MPSTIEKVYRELKGKKLTVLAIDVQEDPAKVEAWVKSRATTPPVLLDRDGRVASQYRVTATPTVVLIDKGGRVVAKGTGTRPWDGPAGKALLEAALAAP